MAKFIVKRFLQMIPVLIFVAFFSFMIIELAPGNVLLSYLRPDMGAEEVEILKEELGINDGPIKKFVGWSKNVLNGNLGYSLMSRRSVADQIKEKLPATVGLMGASLLLALILSIPLGLLSGINKGKPIDNIISTVSYIGISTPSFWLALVLLIIFSLNLKLLPSLGMRTAGVNTVWDLVWHSILPVFVLSLNNIAVFTRYIRVNTIAQMEEEYVDTARAKGASKRRILYGHVMKNCLLPIITLAGMHLSQLVVGSYIIESIFGWPGLGTLGMTAINQRDYPVIMGCTMVSCVILILGNFLADLLYSVCDPRIKQWEADGK